jgi:serine/threonine protein kinase
VGEPGGRSGSALSRVREALLDPARTRFPAKKGASRARAIIPAPQLDQIGRYKIVAKIGQGGMSHVWKGFDATLNRYVAVKTISADAADDPTLKKRFEREARAAAGLNHPHIITVFDFGEEHDKLYMAMELLEGMDLKQAITQSRFHSLEEKLEVMSQICEGLAFAHANEIVHRDLKPANVHVLPDGQVKIMDFGLARVSGSDMTRTGLVMGTPHYMSPEQVRGEHVDYRSDVFALGCLFYEILTGKKPFDADSMHSVLYKVMQEEPKPMRELVPGLPSVLQQILEKAMAKSPAHRFHNAGELGEVLERAREAIGAGLGNEPLPGLVPPSAQPVGSGGPAPRSAPSHASHATPVPRAESHHSISTPPRRGEGSGSRARSQLREPADRTVWYILGVAAVVLIGLGGYLLLSGRGPAASDTGSRDQLFKDIALKKAEAALNRLEAGDYEDALRRADDALGLDKDQRLALEVKGKADAIRVRVETALKQARQPAENPPAEVARAAYWDLLQAAPDHREAGELAATYDPWMKTQAEEARRMMADAQKAAAENTGAPHLDEFKAAAELGRGADSALRASKFATAARDFMRARDRYRRALAQAGGTTRK